MNNKQSKIVNQLEEILEKNRDAQKGYKKAAENAKDSRLKSYFEKKSMDRNGFNMSLKNELVANYDEIDDAGSFTGTIHRAWMDVKSLFSADDDEAMLEEAIKGDKAAVEEYDEVLEDSNLPQALIQLLREQKNAIRADLSKIKSLEDLA